MPVEVNQKLRRHIQKTTALLIAVVFLLSCAGCCTYHTPPPRPRPDKPHLQPGAKPQQPHRPKPRRKRASDYSRIPRNYPATWQTNTIGN